MSPTNIRYLAIYETLRERVASLAPNTILPTEVDMAEEFGVSRVTIRQSLALLEQAGLIERTRGRGTIVCPPKIVRNNIPMMTLEDDLNSQGIPFETKILVFDKQCGATAPVAKRLKCDVGTRIGYLRLGRIVGRYMLCCEHRYMSAEIADRIQTDLILKRPIAQVIAELGGGPIEHVEFETEILPCDGEASSILGIAFGASVFQNSYTYFLNGGRPLETGAIIYRADRCKFHAVGSMKFE